MDVQTLPLARLHESPTNTRRTWGDLEELAANIGKVGILQPLLARPNEDGYELVFGHRRFRAAKLAKLESVPVMVRELSDEEALEAQIIENKNRTDLHPLEEAEGFEQLVKKHGWTAEDIAATVGLSKAYVYGRLKLLALTKVTRKAFYEGRLTASTALYVARVPEALQGELLEDIERASKDRSWGDSEPDPLGAREVFTLVQDKYMLRLKNAPFDPKDAELVAAAGACATCPKRTGSQPELFADVRGADVCTDPLCFGKKKAASNKRLLEVAKAEGKHVASAKEVKALFPYRNGQLTYDSPKVLLDTKCYEDPKGRTYRALLKGSDAPITVAQDAGGTVHELADKADVAKILRAEGVKGVTAKSRLAQSADSARYKAEQKKIADKAKKKRALTTALITACVEKAKASAPDAAWWTWLVAGVAHGSWHDVEVEISKRRGLDKPGNAGASAKSMERRPKLADAIKKMGVNDLRGMLVELVVTKGAYYSYREGLHEVLAGACKLYNVDPKKVAKTLGATP